MIAIIWLVFACACHKPGGASEACVSDDECKGDRLCDEGKCVPRAPSAGRSAAPPASAVPTVAASDTLPAGSADPGGATSALLATPSAEAKPDDGKGEATIRHAGVSGGAVANAAAVVARMKNRFRICYQEGLKSKPDMAGSVTLIAKIGPNGDVQGVSGTSTSLGPILGCLKSVVSSGSFSPPEGGPAVIEIPITFTKK